MYSILMIMYNNAIIEISINIVMSIVLYLFTQKYGLVYITSITDNCNITDYMDLKLQLLKRLFSW